MKRAPVFLALILLAALSYVLFEAFYLNNIYNSLFLGTTRLSWQSTIIIIVCAALWLATLSFIVFKVRRK
jgi:hypothetical protein